MSKRTAQFVILGIFAARITAELLGAVPDSVEMHFDSLLVLAQGWMTMEAYNRNVDGTKAEQYRDIHDYD